MAMGVEARAYESWGAVRTHTARSGATLVVSTCAAIPRRVARPSLVAARGDCQTAVWRLARSASGWCITGFPSVAGHCSRDRPMRADGLFEDRRTRLHGRCLARGEDSQWLRSQRGASLATTRGAIVLQRERTRAHRTGLPCGGLTRRRRCLGWRRRCWPRRRLCLWYRGCVGCVGDADELGNVAIVRRRCCFDAIDDDDRIAVRLV